MTKWWLRESFKKLKEDGIASCIIFAKNKFPYGPTGMRYWLSRYRNLHPPTVILTEKIGSRKQTSGRGRKYNITDYGAIGDGVVDDSDAFKTVFKKIRAGDVVYIPEGEYIVKPGIINIDTDNITIKGEGKDTVLRCASMDLKNWGRYGFINIEGESINSRVKNIKVQNVCVDGNKNDLTGKCDGWEELIRLSFAEGCLLKNISVENSIYNGIQTHGSRWNLIISCDCSNIDGSGIHVSEENYNISIHNIIIDNTVSGCGFRLNRNGIDQSPNSFGNIFINNNSMSNNRNYRILGFNARFYNNKSVKNNAANDVLSGIKEPESCIACDTSYVFV